MSEGDEYIYYTVTSSETIKFGASSNIETRQKSHYTSSPFLKMCTFRVNDAFKAETELHKMVAKYKLKHGDLVNNTIINDDAQLDEHYKMTEEEAIKICEIIQEKYNENKPLDHDRAYCVGCHHVVNISTLSKNDGFRCKRCYDKVSNIIFNR